MDKIFEQALLENNRAIAERDATIQRLLNDNARLKTELSRIKEGVEKLPVIPVKRTTSFEFFYNVSTIDVVQKTDLDKLMKGGE